MLLLCFALRICFCFLNFFVYFEGVWFIMQVHVNARVCVAGLCVCVREREGMKSTVTEQVKQCIFPFLTVLKTVALGPDIFSCLLLMLFANV